MCGRKVRFFQNQQELYKSKENWIGYIIKGDEGRKLQKLFCKSCRQQNPSNPQIVDCKQLKLNFENQQREKIQQLQPIIQPHIKRLENYKKIILICIDEQYIQFNLNGTYLFNYKLKNIKIHELNRLDSYNNTVRSAAFLLMVLHSHLVVMIIQFVYGMLRQERKFNLQMRYINICQHNCKLHSHNRIFFKLTQKLQSSVYLKHHNFTHKVCQSQKESLKIIKALIQDHFFKYLGSNI
ncbi:unnamed protein product [Paramecium pentaurelia]|uniref:Transmembrane protein n=1 Tax=Paramecium pentaurelia TaxID=43138 RepID=A0A8S1UX91_9CILI|nr:unnamed protein product [Paramecium pentaurelia]